MRIQAFRSIALAALISAPAFAQTPAVQPDWSVLNRPRTHKPAPTTPAITAADLATRLYIFADDSMMGRELGYPGNYKGVEYIAAEAKRMGLIPMGDNGTYFQTVGVIARGFDPSSQFTVGSVSFTPGTDFIMRDAGTGGRSLSGVQVVYGGSLADTTTFIDSTASAGKLVIVNAPGGSASGRNLFTALRQLQRFAGAAGVALVNLDEFPPAVLQQLAQPRQSVKSEQLAPASPSFLFVTHGAASRLLGASVDSVKPGTLGGTVTSAPRISESPIKIPARNVVAMIQGSDPKLRTEFVAIGGHNDHIGFSSRPVAHDSIYVLNHLFREQGADSRAPQLTPEQFAQINATLAAIRKSNGGTSARLDSIYNGADDDGSGSVSVLEIAQYFAAKKVKPKRSLLFVWHVGEEEGLYGSQWITDHPPVARDSIVTQLNIDMIGRGGPNDVTGSAKDGGKLHGNPDYVQLIGSRRLSTELGNLADSLDKTEKPPLSIDYALDANGHPQRIYCRSDHYEYGRYGIPIIFFTTGGHADYHQVTDEPQYIDYNRMARVAQFVADIATSVGNLNHAPVVDQPKPDPHGRCVQ